ncbi:MAG: trigger factor [Gracilibacteraceae bacterium]|nr:trigger factor [Gracilibacteraceae bacterium]
MPVKVEKIGPNQVELEITVEETVFNEQLRKTTKKLAGQVNIPGFRKGKAPLRFLEARLGKEYIWHEAAEEIMDPEYVKAVAAEGLTPVSTPEADIVQIEADKEFIFKVKLFVKPEIELGEYKDLGIDEPQVSVTEDELAAELEERRRRHAKLINVEEGAAEDGDSVTVDYTGAVDGEPLLDGETENRDLTIGLESFPPGLAEQVKGMSIGEEKDITVTLPAVYHEENFAGKDAVLHVKLLGIKRTELLPLDDEFAKDVSEFDTMDEYKEDVRQAMLKKARDLSKEEWREKILDKALDNAVLTDIPPSMLESKVESMIADADRRIRMLGYAPEDYYENYEMVIKAMRERYGEQAERHVKADLFYEAVVAREDIQLSEEEVNSSLARILGSGSGLEVFKQLLQQRDGMEPFLQGLRKEKAADLILRANNFPVPEKDAGPEDEPQPEEVSGLEEELQSESEPRPEDGPKPEDGPRPEDGPKLGDEPRPEDGPKLGDEPRPQCDPG